MANIPLQSSMGNHAVFAYLPAYNVQSSVPELIARTAAAKAKLASRGFLLQQMLFIDDGSLDGTAKRIASLARKHKFVRLIRIKKNRGAMNALLIGMRSSIEAAKKSGVPLKRCIFVRMDSDLEHQPEDLEKMISPIMSGKAKITSGFVPLDSRNGMAAEWFNKRIGKSESREFLGIEIPQFCPGFHAVRADAAKKLYPALEAAADEFKRCYSMPMLTLDIVILALAKHLGFALQAIRLRPIEDKWIKKFGLAKTISYLDYHRKTVAFLRGK